MKQKTEMSRKSAVRRFRLAMGSLMFAMIMLFSSGVLTAAIAGTAHENNARIEAINQRVQEIRTMDRASMSRVERATVKKELKEMKKEVRQLDPAGVYISGAALIIIIILLILLL